MNQTFDIWQLVAGIGVFLFGMILLEESVKALSGKAFRRMIRNYTDGRLKAIGSGSLVTAILQSSSAVSLMVLAFVGAGIMSMENAIGVMIGSNIGTTFTAWIVATLGFKVKIESFALPLIGIGGIGLVLFSSSQKLFHSSRLLIGFGFLFLGLNYMKESVEVVAQSFDLNTIPNYGLWLYVLVGAILTALMQSSSASIAIVLTALNSQIITFHIGVAMVIGANVGTTITVLLGALGGTQAKKRVGMSHLVFNVMTAIIALLCLPLFVALIKLFIDIESNSVMGLALFHTIFNVAGVILIFPFVGFLARFLVKIYPDQKAVLAAYIHHTPTEVVDAATAALRNEILHLLVECQLYGIRTLKIEENIVFDGPTPFEKGRKKKFTIESLYENIKILHGEIFSFYSRLQSQQLEEGEAHELERVIYASRNIINSIKNIKGIRQNLDEFDSSENPYLNNQYTLFRKRLVELHHEMDRIKQMESQEEQYARLLETFVRVDNLDKRFIKETMAAAADKKVQDMDISSLLLVNRLFTQSCRLQVFSLKDLLLTQEQINNFDRALDMKTILDDEKTKNREE
ncbi:MAG: Na/Pi symporter [Desulfobulbaceae bacterium]|uniref:Na/Pi symporter n=1 Tax=Candidatus Desulfobia pelagia TaxID=2841692 RepID=A0A8J6NAD5_9BACT|nr:Na/Pi symporter [Candidatus Desulfobia pelagia]